jgi:hypothetical protein
MAHTPTNLLPPDQDLDFLQKCESALKNLRLTYKSPDTQTIKTATDNLETFSKDPDFINVLLYIIKSPSQTTRPDQQAAASCLKQKIQVMKISQFLTADYKSTLQSSLFDAINTTGIPFCIVDLLVECLENLIMMSPDGSALKVLYPLLWQNITTLESNKLYGS